MDGWLDSGTGINWRWRYAAERIDVEFDGALFQTAYGTTREEKRNMCSGGADDGFAMS